MSGAEEGLATPTLARLWLSQGHFWEAARMVEALKARGEAEAAVEALEAERFRRVGILKGLLESGPMGASSEGHGVQASRMSFREALEKICGQVEGALAASIMGYDGIAVETHEQGEAQSEVDLSSAMVEYANVFGHVRSAAEQLEAGTASEFTLRAEKLVAVGRVITPDYFVVLALRPDGNQGKARYVLRVGAGKLAADLS